MARRLPASRAGFVGLSGAFLRLRFGVIASWRTQNDLALTVPVGDRQSLQDHVEPVARLVRKGRTDGEPKVILAFATFDDGVGTIRGLLIGHCWPPFRCWGF